MISMKNNESITSSTKNQSSHKTVSINAILQGITDAVYISNSASTMFQNFLKSLSGCINQRGKISFVVCCVTHVFRRECLLNIFISVFSSSPSPVPKSLMFYDRLENKFKGLILAKLRFQTPLNLLFLTGMSRILRIGLSGKCSSSSIIELLSYKSV